MAFREGLKFGVPPLVLGILTGWAEWTWPAVFFLLLAGFIFFFFRDPERKLPASPSAVVSPADGRVLEVGEETLEGRPGSRISIFLSVFNVHVNRSPVAGRIESAEYRPGKFFAAMKARASAENERNVIRLDSGRGPVVVEQIAGWVARRVLLWKPVGARLARGERLGMIRFGSRVELWLPREARVTVKPGDNVRGGADVVAEWP